MLLGLRYLLLILPVFVTTASIQLEDGAVFAFHCLVLLAWTELRRSWLPPAGHTTAAAAELIYITWLASQYGGMLFACHYSALASYMDGRHKSSRWLLLALQAVLLHAAIPEATPPAWRFTALLLLAAGAALLYLLAEAGTTKQEMERVYDELRRKAYELEAARRRLIEYAGKVEQLAQAEERTRIARDIHDDLGHRLIRLKMMSEAAIRIAPQRPDDALTLIGQVRDQLTEGMDTLRRTVRRLHTPGEETRTYTLSRLIEELSSDTSLRIRHTVTGMPQPLYPSLEVVLYRNAQEAVTNAIRHGQASEVRIELHYDFSGVTMVVANNGIVPVPGSIRKGLGLGGMEERTGLVGGRLSWESGESFVITTWVPLSA